MKVYWSDILYPHDEAREVRLFTRRRDRDAYIAEEIVAYPDVIANAKEWEPSADDTSGRVAVYAFKGD